MQSKSDNIDERQKKNEEIAVNIVAALKYLLNYANYGTWEQWNLNVKFITSLHWAFCHNKIGCQIISF